MEGVQFKWCIGLATTLHQFHCSFLFRFICFTSKYIKKGVNTKNRIPYCCTSTQSQTPICSFCHWIIWTRSPGLWTVHGLSPNEVLLCAGFAGKTTQQEWQNL